MQHRDVVRGKKHRQTEKTHAETGHKATHVHLNTHVNLNIYL